jgi:signal transduction histidine kinase
MAILAALLLSVILQLGASFLALSLIKRTKYNASWILISIGFSLMAFQRVYDLISLFHNDVRLAQESLVSSWLSVVVSLVIFIGTFFIKKIFNLQDRIESIRKGNEQRIFSAIIRTEERERQAFAKELHDGLGPILSSIKMAISALTFSPDSKTDKEIIKKTTYAIDEAIITIKEISNKLSPHVLTNYGIERAVRNFTDTILLHKNLDVSITSTISSVRFDYNIETVVYRVLCELIANTLQHAQASHIVIDIDVNESVLKIQYTDDGVGFELHEIREKGMGLSNIQSRIASLHGNCEFVSTFQKGVFVYISIPLKYE